MGVVTGAVVGLGRKVGVGSVFVGEVQPARTIKIEHIKTPKVTVFDIISLLYQFYRDTPTYFTGLCYTLLVLGQMLLTHDAKSHITPRGVKK